MPKYGSASAGFFPSSSSASFVPSSAAPVAPHPFLFNSSRPAIRHPPVGCRIGRRRRHPHLQPRSLMRAVIFISSSGGPFPSEWTSSSAGRAGSTKTPTSSSNDPPLPFSVVSSSFGPPVSLTVGVVSYHRCIRHQTEHGRNIPAPIMTTLVDASDNSSNHDRQ